MPSRIGEPIENPRELRGLAILAMGSQIKRIDADSYRVNSQSGNGAYKVSKQALGNWTCECPDFTYRGVVCKHIHSVIFSQGLRQRVTSDNLNLPVEASEFDGCVYCGSKDFVKKGLRKTLRGNIQKYLCRSCGRWFIQSHGFEHMKSQPQVVLAAIDLYFKGVSLRKITHFLKQNYGVSVHNTSILKWLRKYITLMAGYVNGLQPQVGGIWHADEMMVNVKQAQMERGHYEWLWNLMDHDTRFLLASKMSKRREVSDARSLFAEGRNRAGMRPDFIITDGLQSYRGAYAKEFWTQKSPKTQHVAVPLTRSPNNNRVERLHGTIRERVKVMRGMQKESTAQVLMDGQRIYYNFVKPHQALNGSTPADRAGLLLRGDTNKWRSLIEISAREKRHVGGVSQQDDD